MAKLSLLAVFGTALLASIFSAAAQIYPSKPVRLIIGPASGGPTDVMARTFAAKMSEIRGQQLVVDNRPGAGNTIGSAIASQAPPMVIRCWSVRSRMQLHQRYTRNSSITC